MCRLKRLGGIVLPLILILAGCGDAKPTEGVLVSHSATVVPPAVTLLFVGDIMLARTPGQALARGDDPFAAFGPQLQQADLAVGNLECAVATVGSRVPKLYNFRCHPRSVAPLAKYFGAVSVANNHAGDFGRGAFAEELDLLTKGGVPYFGGGHDAAEAHSALIVERKGLKIGLLGYDEVELRSYEAGRDTPGVAWSDDDQVMADIAAVRAKVDLLVVYPHWGLEYHFQPSDRQRALSRKMIDAGADLVVGSHPHVTETAEYYKGRLIVYSLGNFVFDDFLDVGPSLKEPSRTSWVLRVTMDRTGLVTWDTLIARNDDSGFPRPVHGTAGPCGARESQAIGQCKTN
ncbi:MAG TPA: CapA family protein [Symbiobacteriaceae bacterium]|jgi:poly-gamma-glutamate synthesis protein (capsule biosynthesis protein)